MRFIFLPALLLGLAACGAKEETVPPVRQGGELVVITRNSPTTYYEDAQGNYAGLEYDLVTLFARELGVPARFVIARQFNQILPTVLHHKAHFAAGLSTTPERSKKVRFSSPYQTVQQQLVYSTDTLRPRNPRDLVGKRIEVVTGSSHAERLKEVRKQFPGIHWYEIAAQESEELLEKVSGSVIDYTVSDSNIIDVARNFYPNLGVAFNLGNPEQLAWAFPRDADPALLRQAEQFFRRIEQNGTLKRLLDRYYGHVRRLEQADVAGFLEKMRSVLPRFRRIFQQAQEITGIDWRLLAALGYQESHWDPLATSPTGVRGLMMLTADTADRMGVTDRLEPAQNIPAGANYLLGLKDVLPQRIPEPDRTWLALAAYNVGYGHLEDARILAQRQKLNPDSWLDLKKSLPLLSRSEYFDALKHGYARGGEPVIFVENIRTYYDILLKFEKPHKPVFMPLEAGKTDRSAFAPPSA